MQQQALQQIAHVDVRYRSRQQRIQNMQWENRTLHELAAQDRQQIKNQIEQARRENREWHQIAQQERAQIQLAVQQNAALIAQNRQEIQQNREELQRGFETVTREMLSLEDRQRLELLRTAGQLLDDASAKGLSIPTQWMERFDPEGYRHAADAMRRAQEHFMAGDYRTAAHEAQTSLDR